MKQPLVTFGIVNCNRLHYLRACFESLIDCTRGYENLEFIVVDNASVERETSEYLDRIESDGVHVFRNSSRDPNNEFARGLNTIVDASSGEFIVLLQGDMQFVRQDDWLHEYVEWISHPSNSSIACVTLDAVRRITNLKRSHVRPFIGSDKFVVNMNIPPYMGAGDMFTRRDVIMKFGKWRTVNADHEGGNDSETDMLHRVSRILKNENTIMHSASPVMPPAIAIYTDPRGTNARVRGNRMYGKYWRAEGDRYYKYVDGTLLPRDNGVVSIETLAVPNGWQPMIDQEGNWLKNPIRVDTAKPSDFIELDDLR